MSHVAVDTYSSHHNTVIPQIWFMGNMNGKKLQRCALMEVYSSLCQRHGLSFVMKGTVRSIERIQM